jgi:hypothetical protein
MVDYSHVTQEEVLRVLNAIRRDTEALLQDTWRSCTLGTDCPYCPRMITLDALSPAELDAYLDQRFAEVDAYEAGHGMQQRR